ncbi:riboflavin synthase [Acidipila sp. EB88]|uniref:riboflavin synthase n=1 Tax=Acidipila sp. EB88 TaxID=2305226 RepID=UPI000F5F2059|nr:riboflavin synthase [Acidipila sp. EB88]RRA50126.1 riboflavin synthase [Acidipila sp. EB88]
MFTGLVQSMGTIESVTPAAGTLRLAVLAPKLAASLKVGDSVAVSGVCLTALEPGADRFYAELAQETVDRTSLAALAVGSAVNLELPTPAGTPLGGHIVQGHVDATGELLGLERIGEGERTDWRLRVAVPPAVGRFVVEKGSVTIEGISLTVARWFPEKDAQDDTLTGAGELHVAVIPHTYEATNLHTLQVGSRVNLEADVLMKLAVQNGLLGPGRNDDQWTRLAERDTTGDVGFAVSLEYLMANGY